MAQISRLEQLPRAKPHPHVWTGGPRGGKQLRGKYRESSIDALIELDGPYCRADVCKLGRDFGSDRALSVPGFRYSIFTIDHLGGPTAHWLDLERLAHWVCNNETDKQHAKRHSSRRERESGAGARELPTEVDLNVRLYAKYQRWLEDQDFPVPLDEAIFTAAREIHAKMGHGAHQTIRGYLQVLTVGRTAPYLIDSDKKVLLRRKDYEEGRTK